MKQIAQSKSFYGQEAARTIFRSGFRRIARCGETSEEIVAIYRPDIPPHVAEIVRHLPPAVKRSVKAGH
jgi:hypothetical protein